MGGHDPAGFNLFDSEERALADAEALLASLPDTSGDTGARVAALVAAYRRNVREQRRLVWSLP